MSKAHDVVPKRGTLIHSTGELPLKTITQEVGGKTFTSQNKVVKVQNAITRLRRRCCNQIVFMTRKRSSGGLKSKRKRGN